MAVRGARLYVAQIAEVVTGQSLNWNQIYSGGKPTFEAKSLEAGKTYAFRLAAMGGSTGQSEWSPEVRMMA